MPLEESRKILIVAAEASSCLYAQRLLELWKRQNLKVEAFGIGDQAMEKAGFECLARAEEMAVVGIQEVLAHWSVIKKAFQDLLKAAESKKPDVVLLLDYPGFNLRFAKKMKALGYPVVYYISPQVWAWKQGRVKAIKQTVDKMLVVFPFEVDFYKQHDYPVEFVGHPLLDELSLKPLGGKTREVNRARYGIGQDDILLALMPGSRRSEIKHHLKLQIAAAQQLADTYPRLKVALLAAPNFSLADVQSWLSDLNFPLVLIKDDPFSMIDLADVVLCASGTATLMVGLLEKPMVIMYRMNRLTAFLARQLVTSTKYFGLINLVLDKKVAPELFQQEAETDNLVKVLTPLITDPSERERMATELRMAKERLGNRGATERVAQVISQYWKQGRQV